MLQSDVKSSERDIERFVRQHEQWLLPYCVSRLGSREEAEDALQLVYLNAWRALERGTEPRYPGAWLAAVARNVCHAKLAASRRRTSFERTSEPNEVADERVADRRPSSSEDVGEIDALVWAVGRLPENQKRALLLREWQGLSYQEISTKLELSQAAVEMLLFRARSTVRRLTAPEAIRSAAAVRTLLFFPLGDLSGRLRDMVLGLSTAKAAATIAAGVAGPALVTGVVAHEQRSLPWQSAPAVAQATGVPQDSPAAPRVRIGSAERGSSSAGAGGSGSWVASQPTFLSGEPSAASDSAGDSLLPPQAESSLEEPTTNAADDTLSDGLTVEEPEPPVADGGDDGQSGAGPVPHSGADSKRNEEQDAGTPDGGGKGSGPPGRPAASPDPPATPAAPVQSPSDARRGDKQPKHKQPKNRPIDAKPQKGKPETGSVDSER